MSDDEMDTGDYVLLGMLVVAIVGAAGYMGLLAGDVLAHLVWGTPEANAETWSPSVWGYAWRIGVGVVAVPAGLGLLFGGLYALGRGVELAYDRAVAWYTYLRGDAP